MSKNSSLDKYQTKQILNGFEIKKINYLKNIFSTAISMTHSKSGAKLLYLYNKDEKENLFSIAFKTPSVDNTGLPHILEHTVLCGSKNFPIKDPFAELLKTSLATFLNAMTYPDKTVYPCASVNEKDFHNIIRVYCDAVFFPILSEKHFKQEGHHLTFKEKNHIASDLTIDGIVYNEMQGVYSDLDSIISNQATEAIYPDNAYGKDSGGNPDYIPDLTYAKFKEYHKTYYHPSNSYIFIYGSFGIEKILNLLDIEYLSKFSKIKVPSDINFQPKWTNPIKKTIKYPLGQEENKRDRSAVTVNFKTNNITDILTTMAMCAIEIYLLDNDSSPLKKALIDSKLGEALTNSGYGDYQRDTFFSVGLKNTKSNKSKDILGLIISTCKNIAHQGFDRKKMESAFDKLEFNSREIQSSYPLVLMDRVYNCWLYNISPLTFLEIEKYIEKLRKLFKEDPQFFTSILEQYIINNPHYSLITFVPDKKYFLEKEKALREKMNDLKKNMPKEVLKKILKDTIELEKMQKKPNSKSALAKLPKLSLNDIDKNTDILKTELEYINGIPVIYPEMFSNDICYLNIAFNIKDFQTELLEYMPLFRSTVLKMGTKKHNFEEMAEREAALTGGMHAELAADGDFRTPNSYNPIISISSKAITSKLQGMLDLFKERLFDTDFTNIDRLKEVILQRRTNLKSSILPNGSTYAALYAGKNLGQNTYVTELFSGISRLRMFNRVADNFAKEFKFYSETLQCILMKLANKKRITISFIGNKQERIIFNKWLYTISKNISSEKIDTLTINLPHQISTQFSGIMLPANVSFNAAIVNTIPAVDKYAPALFALSHYLSYGYLWEEIRAIRGAYGVKASYSTFNGTFLLSSYRDPNIQKTYETFFNVSNYLKDNMDYSKKHLEQIIIGTIKKLDRPIRPEDAVNIALLRYIRNVSDEDRKKFRDGVLTINEKKIIETIENIIEPNLTKLSLCSISSRENLKDINIPTIKQYKIEHI